MDYSISAKAKLPKPLGPKCMTLIQHLIQPQPPQKYKHPSPSGSMALTADFSAQAQDPGLKGLDPLGAHAQAWHFSVTCLD